MSTNNSNLKLQIKYWIYNGASYKHIENKLVKLKVDPDEIKEYLKAFDDHRVNYELAMQVKSKFFNQIIIGAVFLFLGLAITIFTYLSSESSYILAWGSILGGGWYLREGYMNYKRPIDELIPKHRRPRRRKFDKY